MSEARKPSRAKGRHTDGKGIIEAAALRAFYRRGYHGTSIRDIAAEADMTAASLYHHFTNKQEILCVLMTQIMQEALSATRAGLLRAGSSPAEQLSGLVSAWVTFHAKRQIEARVGLSELNSLEDHGRRLVVALRDEQESMFRDIVLRGVEVGDFRTTHPLEAARAILNMGTAVATWFRAGGAISASELAETYVDLALATVQDKGGGAV
ncbi:TetR family transcriptional regulator [Rhodococcus koreensis]